MNERTARRGRGHGAGLLRVKNTGASPEVRPDGSPRRTEQQRAAEKHGGEIGPGKEVIEAGDIDLPLQPNGIRQPGTKAKPAADTIAGAEGRCLGVRHPQDRHLDRAGALGLGHRHDGPPK